MIDQTQLLNDEHLAAETSKNTDSSGVFKPDTETDQRMEDESILFRDGRPKFIE